MLQYYIRLTVVVIALLGNTAASLADAKVVTTIKPLHSIASAVMQGAGEPKLLLDGASSPHTYAFTPRDAQAMQDAEIVFWIGPGLETFLVKPLATLGSEAWANPLISAKGVETLEVREEHDHGHEHSHDEHGESDHDDKGAHVWLDPRNAAVIADAMVEALSKADPANAMLFKENAIALKAKLQALEAEIAADMSTTESQPIVVTHDAYQYFEKRFGLPASFMLSVHPENPPGAKALRKIRDELQQQKAKCVFSEPQFDTKLVATVTEGLEVKIGELDPLGAAIPQGPDMYFTLLKDIAKTWKPCL
jgi:zinc transport system substrate-binding protein